MSAPAYRKLLTSSAREGDMESISLAAIVPWTVCSVPEGPPDPPIISAIDRRKHS